MRWKQTLNEETQKYEFIPVDEAARKSDSAYVMGDIDAFVSPVDGSIISDRKQLREHNKRNNVVSADNFSPEFQKRKADERHEAEHGKQAVLERKQAMYEVMMRSIRNN